MPYQALIFDVGGVIVPHDNAALYARLASRCRAERALEVISSEALARPYHTGELTIAQLHQRLRDELATRPTGTNSHQTSAPICRSTRTCWRSRPSWPATIG
jgi:hypothetical protein